MRRMMTSKQSDYVNGLSEVAEKGFKVDTYPYNIITKAFLDLEINFKNWVANESINFTTHIIDAPYVTLFNEDLLLHYGLHGNGEGELPSIALQFKNSIAFPETIEDEESLKQYLMSTAGILAMLNCFNNDDKISLDEIYILNNIASYNVTDWASFINENNQVTLTYVSLRCASGQGQQITGASDPIGIDTLDVGAVQIKNDPFSVCLKATNYGLEITDQLSRPASVGVNSILFNSNNPSLDSEKGLDILAGWVNDEGEYNTEINCQNDGITIDPDYCATGESYLKILNLPTSDPQVTGALWNDNGVLKISAGQ